MTDPDQIAGWLLVAFALACLAVTGWRELSGANSAAAEEVRRFERAEAAERLVAATANKDFYDSRGITR